MEPAKEEKPKLDPYEISWVIIGNGQPKDTAMVEEAANKYLKDKINATVKLTVLDFGSFDNKTNAMIATAEKFDIIFTAYWKSYRTNALKGAYQPIDELLTKHAPKTKALFSEEFLKGARIDGKLYALPANKDKAQAHGFLYRKDIADKHGIDMSKVKTYTDIEPILQTIKEKEPNLIPYMTTLLPMHYTGLFDFTTGNETPAVLYTNKNDGKIVNVYETPEFMDYQKTIRSWYEKGYIPKDIGTRQPNQITADLREGKAFAWPEQLKPGKDAETQNGLKNQSPETKIGQHYITSPVVTTNDTTGSMMAISKTSKDPARAMMFLELLNTDPYLNNLFNFGIEGTHYKKVEGKTNIIEPVKDAGYTMVGSNWIIGNQYINYLLPNEDPNKWKNFQEFNDKAKPAPSLGFSFNPDTVKTEIAAIKAAVKEFELIGNGSIDPVVYIPKLNEKLKAAGVDKVIAEVQKQYDEFKKK